MSDVPDDAPEHCPGTESEKAGRSEPCEGCPNQSICASGQLANQPPDPALVEIAQRMSTVKHKILVLSGKGGVGKSTFSSTLARTLAQIDKTRQIGVLDVDICGPSQARMFGAESEQVHQSMSGWSPIFVQDNLALMSISFLLDNRNNAVVWRGPRKNGLIKQFLKDVDWGDLDYLIIDTPPGTSDEHISLVQYLLGATNVDGAVLITTPQEVSLLDVRKEANFCQKTKLTMLGVVENMSTFVCPCCNNQSVIFPPTTGGASAMCQELGLEFLGKIPLDPRLASCTDEGSNFLEKYQHTPAAVAYQDLAKKLIESCERVV